MTTATATEVEELDLEQIHPVWSAKYGIQTCETELKKLAETEEALAEERMTILREKDTEAPGTKTRLEWLESEIGRLQVRQTREGDKIKALTDELPGLRVEAEKQLNELITLEERLPKVAGEIESLDSRLAEILSKELAQRLIDLIGKRNQAVKEFKGLPFLISGVKSYFHLLPGTEQVEVPKLPEHICDLGKALSK